MIGTTAAPHGRGDVDGFGLAGIQPRRVALLSEKHSAGRSAPSGRAATFAGFRGNARLRTGNLRRGRRRSAPAATSPRGGREDFSAFGWQWREVLSDRPPAELAPPRAAQADDPHRHPGNRPQTSGHEGDDELKAMIEAAAINPAFASACLAEAGRGHFDGVKGVSHRCRVSTPDVAGVRRQCNILPAQKPARVLAPAGQPAPPTGHAGASDL